MANIGIASGWNIPPTENVTVQFPGKTQPTFVPPLSFGWYQPWSMPPPPNRKEMRRYENQDLAWSTNTPALRIAWLTPFPMPVLKRKAQQQQTLAWNTTTPAAAFDTFWFSPFSEPVRRNPPPQQHLPQAWLGPNPEDVSWHQPFSTPMLRRKVLQAMDLAWAGFTQDDNSLAWFSALSEPPTRRKVAQSPLLAWSTFTPAAEDTTITWFSPLSTPVREGVVVSNAVFGFVAVTQAAAENEWWFDPWATPRWKKTNPAAYRDAFFGSLFPITPTFGWYEQFTERPRTNKRLPFQQFYTSDPTTPAPVVVNTGWYSPFSEPTRTNRRLAFQQFTATDPTTPAPAVINPGWLPWSEPVRVRARLQPSVNPFIVTDPKPPFPTFGWYDPLSEPVRLKKGLRAPYQRPTTFDPLPIVNRGVMGWYNWLSEPMRQKKGMRVFLQPSFFAPERILANPIFISMLAVEDANDIFTAGVALDQQPPLPSQGGAVVTIIEITRPGGSGGLSSIGE